MGRDTVFNFGILGIVEKYPVVSGGVTHMVILILFADSATSE